MCSILNYGLLCFLTVYIFCTGHKSGLPRFCVRYRKLICSGNGAHLPYCSVRIPFSRYPNWYRRRSHKMWCEWGLTWGSWLTCALFTLNQLLSDIFKENTCYLPDIQSIHFGSSISINVIFYSVQVKLWRKEKTKVDCYRKVKCVLIILDRPENWLM